MISTVLIIVFFFAVITYKTYVYVNFRPNNFPPGPPKLPWIGSYIFIYLLDRVHSHRAINRICRYYKSTVIGCHLGEQPLVIVNDHKNVRKLLKHPDFNGRPVSLMIEVRHPNSEVLHGIFDTERELWSQQKQFMLRNLRHFNFGRRSATLENESAFQIAQHFDIIRNGPKYAHEHKYFANGKIFLPYAFAPVFYNCMMTILTKESVRRKDMADVYTMSAHEFTYIRATDTYGKWYSVMPCIAKLFPDRSGFKDARDSSLHLHTFFSNIVDKQIRTFDTNNDRHFIDVYIRKIRESELKPDVAPHFSYEQLILSCIDFVIPSLLALPATITLLIQQICHEPDMQRKIQEEIDRVIGQSRAPTLDDRVDLPYTEACLREIMRNETLLPSSLPHKALIDTEFLGYNIPKGTIVIPALDASMHDDTVWEKPAEFRPERFLDSSGQLCLSKDISLPFGAGKRLCAGETYARNMLFLFAFAFFQAFSVGLSKGERPIDFKDNLNGILRTTPDHWVSVTPR